MMPDSDVRVIPLYTVPSTPLAQVDPARFAGRDGVVFVGGYAHPPNEDAAIWLAKEIMPLVWDQVPTAKLVLLGSKPPPAVLALAEARVAVPGWLPDIDPIYAASRVSLSPLRYGAGVKGKIIGALQAGLPVVTTTIGNEGLGLADGREALIGDTAQALADHAIALLRDPMLCARLAAAGAVVLRERFDEDGARRILMSVLGRSLCPVCGHRGTTEDKPVTSDPCPSPCPSCGAVETDCCLAEAAIRPFRGIGVASLRDAIPLLGQFHLPEGPLSAVASLPPTGGVAPDPAWPTLTITGTAGHDFGNQDFGDISAAPSGSRWISQGTEADIPPVFDRAGWQVRLHQVGVPVIEVERIGTDA
jgi:hypothetical protein